MFIFVLNNRLRMKKILYFIIGIIVIGSASSCSKQCVQCTAIDRYGVTINTSNVVCDANFERKQFEKRYETNYSGYQTACVNVNN